ncbi:MAG: hypothetical protein ACPG4T_21925 [Nannocystaceae bacterium]
MTTTILLTIGLFGAIMLGMAVGVLVAGKTLKGSCGGISGDCDCTPTERENCSDVETAA